MKKTKKIFIVPHTHWDREWMFSEQTANVLLNQMMNELITIIKKDNDFKMVLDGQASLVDDFLKSNPNKLKEFLNEAKKDQVSFGPWYSQPDVFSALGETTIRNLEVGMETITNLGLKTLPTAYLPDTFGFNSNLPQIFIKNKLNNFIHWRGLTKKQIKNFGVYEWKGIDGSIVKAANYNFGYYCLGQYYPYDGITKDNVSSKANKFLNNAKEIIDKTFASVPGDSILLPLGGDQAPANHGVSLFLKEVNKLDKENEWIISNNFNSFFNEYKTTKLPQIEGDLKTAIAGRIHRTIASSRYDIKKIFRQNELKLFYVLEPLEFIYKQMDSSYDYDEYKLTQIIKPLLKLQAHDSLGGCNSDITNDDIIAKSKQIKRNIEAMIDLIEYKIIRTHNHQLSKNVVNLINQFPDKRNIHKHMTIFSNHKNIDKSTKDISIKTLSSESVAHNFPIYKHKVFIKGKGLKAFDYKIIDLDKVSEPTKETDIKTKISFENNLINVLLPSGEFKFKFKIDNDSGDNYDYSPGKNLEFKQRHKLEKNFSIDESEVHFIKTSLESKNILEITSRITVVDGIADLDIFINNTEVGKRVSIEFVGTNNVFKTTHLALTKFNDEDQRKDWEKDMSEFPYINDYSDGLIKMEGKNGYNLFVAGTNEFTKTNSGISVVLYRTNKYTSVRDLDWRPGRASGIQYNEITLSSQLKQKLEFNFRITFQDSIRHLNNWNFLPTIHYKNSVHLTAHKMNKFEINEIIGKPQKIQLPKIDVDKLLISKMKIKNNKPELRIANIQKQKVEAQINGKPILFKPFEYKNI